VGQTFLSAASLADRNVCPTRRTDKVQETPLTGFGALADGHAVRGFGVVQAGLDAIAPLRDKPGAAVGRPLAANFLKYADDQAVAGMAAVWRAMQDCGLRDHDFTDWAVVGAPRYLGRLAAATTLYRFYREGVSRASPLIVSHRSLHSVASTVSQALRIHGPNFGAGGGPGSAAEGLLLALSFLEEGQVPGVWVVLTECDPEPLPDETGQPTAPATCHGVALALVPAPGGWQGMRLRLRPAAANGPPVTPPLAELAKLLSSGLPECWSCALDWGACVEVVGASSGVRAAPLAA
jgi:hypothetical protein